MPMIQGKYVPDVDLGKLSEEELAEILDKAYHSKKYFAQLFFPEIFYLPFSEQIHEPIFRILDDKTIQKAVIMAPRGCGKTSLINFLCSAHAILFREYRFVCPISMSATHAIMQSEAVKRELMVNPRVLRIFGSIRTRQMKELEQFSKTQWIAELDEQFWTLVFPRGSGQQIRGISFRQKRPDLFLVDDLEDPQELLNEELRREQRKWFLGDVCPAVQQDQPHRILVLGTLLHPDALINWLAGDKAWVSVTLSICDENLKSYWPEMMSDRKVRERYEEFKRFGLAHVFYREYRSLLIPDEATFREEHINDNYYSEPDLNLNRNQNVESFILVDPGRTLKSLQTSETAIIGVGVNMVSNCFFVRDLIVRRMRPDETIEETFAMAKRLNARIVGVEVTGLEEYVLYPFNSAVLQKGLNLQIVPLYAQRYGHKLDRIAALIPYSRSGRIFYNKCVCGRLVEQLLSYPHSKQTDAMDAFAYIIPLLEIGGRYFSFEGVADDKKQSYEAVEEEYREFYEEYEGDNKGDRYGLRAAS